MNAGGLLLGWLLSRLCLFLLRLLAVRAWCGKTHCFVGHGHVLLRADVDGAGTHLLALLRDLLVVLHVLDHAGVGRSSGRSGRGGRSTLTESSLCCLPKQAAGHLDDATPYFDPVGTRPLDIVNHDIEEMPSRIQGLPL